MPRDNNVIVGGDFNIIMTSKDIKGGRGHSHVKCTEYINQYFEENGLLDIWRIRNPDKFRFTWSKTKPHLLMEWIDYLIISFQLQQYVSMVDIQPSYLSDHSIPTVNITLDNSLDRGLGRWMLNNSFLEETEYCEQIREIIKEAKEIEGMNEAARFELNYDG